MSDAALISPKDPPLVLIVDDHQDSCDLYSLSLQVEQFRTATAYEASSALDLAVTLRPDAIVTDIGMPRIHGWSLIQSLKGDPRTMHIPIVIVSGHADQSARVRAMNEGCAAFCAKPCGPAQLAAVLRSLLGDQAHA